MTALTLLVPSSFTTSGLYRTDTYHPRSPTAHCDKHLIQLGLQYVKFKRKRAMEMLLCETCGEQFDYRTNLTGINYNTNPYLNSSAVNAPKVTVT